MRPAKALLGAGPVWSLLSWPSGARPQPERFAFTVFTNNGHKLTYVVFKRKCNFESSG